MRTYAEMRTLALQILIDAGIEPGGSANQVFANAELDAWIPDCVTEYSKYRPREVKDTTLTATAGTWDVALSAEILRNLIRIATLEYDPKVGQDSAAFRRGFTRFGSTLRLKLDFAPSGGEAVHLYLEKKHLLVNVGTTDLDGAVKTTAAAGAGSISLKSLGTGVINEDTQLTIAGDLTVYTVISKATIAARSSSLHNTSTGRPSTYRRCSHSGRAGFNIRQHRGMAAGGVDRGPGRREQVPAVRRQRLRRERPDTG